MNTRPPLGIVLVNYQRWQDTIECLETVFRSTIPVRVIVVDNASPNGSIAQIIAWARGDLPPNPASPAMAAHSQPPLPKPLDFDVRTPADCHRPASRPLTIVDSGTNLGFAGGNNIGLRLLLADSAIDHFWLLNNDTIISPDTAARLNAVMASTPNIGMAGTTVRFYFQPDIVQAHGGYRFSPLTGQARAIGHGSSAHAPVDAATVASTMDFVLGASLAVSRPFLETVGLMEECYFLYYEEIDWAVRNRRRGAAAFALAFADQAVVWHKEGGSIGSSAVKGERSPLADYWLTRSRLAFTRRHYPLLLPLHWLLTLALVARRLGRRQSNKANNLIRALFARPFSA